MRKIQIKTHCSTLYTTKISEMEKKENLKC